MKKSTTKKLNKKSKDINILNKAKNRNSIRVLYKKAGQAPDVKIISNVQRLKKAIINKQLHIVPYEHLFIICKYKKSKLNVPQNIFLPLNSISGDLLVVKIDRKQREFKALSQEDIMWYSEDLIRKSFNNTVNNNKSYIKQNENKYQKNFEYTANIPLNSFGKELINVLVNIELVLASMLIKENKKNE